MGRDRIHLPGLPRDAARVLIAEIEALKDEQARLRRKAGRAGIVTSDYSAKAGEFVNVEPRSGTLVTITLPESTPALRGARVTLAFRNSNDVRIVAVQGTVNGKAFVMNDRPGTYDATADGLGGWFVQVGVSEEGSGAGGGGGGGGFTPTFGTPVDVGLANSEGVSSDLARADHVHRDRIATAGEDGFLSRAVYANASSAAVGGTYAGQTIEAAPASWATDADIPDGAWFVVDCFAAGGGGAAGSSIANGDADKAGGGGGGGGCHNQAVFARAALVGALPITFTLPLGAAGGTGVLTLGGGAFGNVGATASGPTLFGTLLSAYSGGPGGRGNTTLVPAPGGGGGGALGAGGGPATSTTAQVGGEPGGVAGSNPGWGGGGASVTGGASGFASIWGGAGGATARANNGARSPGGDSVWGGGGGGSGSSRSSGSTTAQVGGEGGVSGAPGNTTRAAGGAGANGSGAAVVASDGATGPTGTYPFAGGGGGGGGDARCTVSGSATGGAGGAGGFPGGGGGGGGPGTMANVVGSGGTGGAGGPGADGCIVVTAFA